MRVPGMYFSLCTICQEIIHASNLKSISKSLLIYFDKTVTSY